MPKAVTSTDLFLEQVVARLDRVITLLEEQRPSDKPAGSSDAPEVASPATGTAEQDRPAASPRKRSRQRRSD